MRVWLLHIGEELPVDGTTRLFRYGYLARALSERGHEVLRWAPTFRHSTKTFRFSTDIRVPIWQNFAIQFVHSPGYRRNVGFERLRTYRVLDRRFRQLAAAEPPPDLIVAAIPSLEWASAATEYGRAHGIPVVIDVRDLWPDVFLNALPKAARSAGRILLGGYERMARRVCRHATALTAVSPSYLNWALTKAERSIQPYDQVVPIGFESESLPANVKHEKLAALAGRGIDLAKPICIFSGLFERSYDLKTVVEAARRFQYEGRTDVQFVLCGDGSKMPILRQQADGLSNVHFLGWIDAPTLQAAHSAASIGLCAYANDALQSLPNKPFEYMASGLPVVSSLSGDLATLLERQQCGLSYRAGDATSLAGTVSELLSDPQRFQVMRANSYQTWFNHYRSQDIYSRFVDHITTLLPDTARAA
jgi:glycosyltransferase involved in cell wall biosynthesis